MDMRSGVKAFRSQARSSGHCGYQRDGETDGGDLELVASPSDYVREIETQDGAALLDIQRGLCLSVNPVGLMIWRQLKRGRSTEQITLKLAAQFCDVPIQDIQTDVEEFVGQVQRHGLLLPPPSPPLPSIHKWILQRCHFRRAKPEVGVTATEHPPRLLVSAALLALLIFDGLQLGKEFRRVCAAVVAWPIATDLPVNNAIELICRALDRACIWYPKRVRCLQRAAVTTCLLRNYGVRAEMVVGAQKLPFRAHAWTEVNGLPVNEREQVQTTYIIWERC